MTEKKHTGGADGGGVSERTETKLDVDGPVSEGAEAKRDIEGTVPERDEAKTDVEEAEAKLDVEGAELDEQARGTEANPDAEAKTEAVEEPLAVAESSEGVPEREADDNPEDAGQEVKAEGSESKEEPGAAEGSPGVTEEAAESAQEPEAVETQDYTTAAAAASPKKGLMQRRKSFLQTSVPNAHRGYNPKIPRIMLGIIAILLIASFILAAVTA